MFHKLPNWKREAGNRGYPTLGPAPVDRAAAAVEEEEGTEEASGDRLISSRPRALLPSSFTILAAPSPSDHGI